MKGTGSQLRGVLQQLRLGWSSCAHQAPASGWSTAAFSSGGEVLPTAARFARLFGGSTATGADSCAATATSNRGGEASTSGGSGGEDDTRGRGSGAPAATAAAGGGLTPPNLLGSKRFYKTVLVERAPGQDGWQLLLDRYPVRTPARNPVVAPTYPLALALAAEWEWLPNGKPIHHAMPLMSLAATAIDQPKPRSRVLDDLLKYAHTDAACVRYEPGTLADRQAKVFDPLLAWARDELGWRLAASDAICGPNQDPRTIEAVRAYLDGLDSWHLAAAEQLTAACKSVVLAAALLRGRLGAAEALEAARLEEAFQIEDWGMVEAGHDLDAADLATRVAAPAVMVGLLRRGGGSGGDGGGRG